MQELIKIIKDYSEIENISPDCEFKADLGLGSFDTVCMINDIKAAFGIETLEPRDFVRYKTVGEMAQYLTSLKK